MRGNDQLNEAKLAAAVGGREFRPMHEEEIVSFFGTPAGYLGPVGLKLAKVSESGGKQQPTRAIRMGSSSCWTRF